MDIDALDPAYAPGVSHREPGGLSTRQVIDFIHTIDQPLVAADIVEYNPRCDISDMTAMVAAKLVKEIGGMMVKTARI
jgi:arginase